MSRIFWLAGIMCAACALEPEPELGAGAQRIAATHKARILELRYFAGMTHEEIGNALEIHANTVARDIRLAEAWVRRSLTAST